ncbi:PIG-L family deacetylase [Opitutaceae bacterium]
MKFHLSPTLTRACLLASLAATTVITRPLVAAELPAPAVILQDLKEFQQMGRVLHIAAHPDDENTLQITYLARARHYQTAYLSITRGDGGQNEIGPEFDAELGLARTHELLEARKDDKGRQYFTRALDFGFSKDYAETLRVWDRQVILGDVVRVIRMFRPDVITTAFSPIPSTTHGHHTASAVLALEAFKLAGNPQAYPEHFNDGLAPWQPTRIFTGAGGGGGRGGPPDGTPGIVRLEVSGNDEVTGEPYGVISARSRGRHITQFGLPGTGAGGGPGGVGRGGAPGAATIISLQFADGTPATTDLMEGIDTSWARVAGGAEISRMTDELVASFNPQNPAASVPAILAIRTRLAAMPRDLILDEKRAQIDAILQACLGLSAETFIANAEVVPGEMLQLQHAVTSRSSIPVRWTGVRYPTAAPTGTTPAAVALAPGQAVSREERVTLPAGTEVTQPYWLRESALPGRFSVADSKLIGRPDNPPAFPVEFLFEVGGQTLVVATEPVQVIRTAGKADKRRALDVISPVNLHFETLVKVIAPGKSAPVQVQVRANRAGADGTLKLELPTGWTATPASQSFNLANPGEVARLTFTVTAPAQVASVDLRAVAEVDGQRFTTDRDVIDYDHLPLLLMQPPARTRAVSVDLAIRGRNVAYLPGAGDDVAECIAQMGYTVTELTGADLTAEKLKGFDAVVIGVRAFNERTDLAANFPGLLAYVEAGGTVVAQYNRPNALTATQLGPYELSIAGPAPDLRITDENSPVTVLATDHPAVNAPNRIAPGDFEGWVQERGAYFPSSWDQDRYTTILGMNDPGQAPLTSSILIAKHGQGHYVYTGLAFFRQLPKGVPGAYRLFANLVSLGK